MSNVSALFMARNLAFVCRDQVVICVVSVRRVMDSERKAIWRLALLESVSNVFIVNISMIKFANLERLLKAKCNVLR